MLSSLLFMCIVVPFIAAIVVYFVRIPAVRSLVVVATGALLAVSSLMMLGQGSFSFALEGATEKSLDVLVALADFGLLFLILYMAYKYKSTLVKWLVGLQIVPLAIFELFMAPHGEVTTFFGDTLAIVIVLLVSIVGSLICIFALPYMDKHEHHLHLTTSKQPRFFFFLLLFLGAMNGLALANNITWLYFFFEITTLCSFMLIGHDQTEIAIKNSVRALWMNSLGGVAFVLAIVWGCTVAGTLDVQQMIAKGPMAGAMLVPLGLLCIAGFTKAAQVPFQSWLLGAMVAPTPVSALLHSSTMVKAGVFVVLRFAPAYAGTFFSSCVAVAGAFTFLVTIALALSQSNGKKILAYSTISNLGLIIACAGINTPLSISAAILLILFHGISKALMFLCVGAIDQQIGSQDLEKMRGLFKVMPRVAVIAVIGILTMMLPPFGVLLSKWMAIEAASTNIVAVSMIALGSALGVVVWGRWAGMLMSTPFSRDYKPEVQPVLTMLPLVILAGSAVVLSFFTPVLYKLLVVPMLQTPPYEVGFGTLDSPVGAFAVYPLFIILALGFVFAMNMARKARGMHTTSMYLGGAQSGGPESDSFIGPMEAPVKVTASNYYLVSIFGEERLTSWINIAALALLVLMMGGAL